MARIINQPPVGVLTADKYEITWPENTITASLQQSYDPVKSGKVIRWQFNEVAGDFEIATPDTNVSEMVFPAPGTYVIGGNVWDKAGNINVNVAQITVTVHPPLVKTKFGGKIQNDAIDNQINVAKQLGLYCIRPAGIAMNTYDGVPNSLRKLSEAGFFTIVNATAVQTAGDNIVEYLKPTDTPTYKEVFRRFLRECKQFIGIVCIENEPINRQYYKGDFSNYINQLRVSVEVAHEEGVLIADGAMHLELVDLVKANRLSDSRAADTKRLLDALKEIPVDYVNVHTSWGKGVGGYRCPDIPGTVQWIREYTGAEVISNEYSSVEITPALETDFVNKWKAAEVVYCMRWSGDGWDGTKYPANPGNNKADALNYGTTLTPLGIAYRDAIK